MPGIVWQHDPMHLWSLVAKAIEKLHPLMVNVLRAIAKTFHVNYFSTWNPLNLLYIFHKFQGKSLKNRQRFDAALKSEIEMGSLKSDAKRVLKLPHKIRVMSAYEAAVIVSPLRPVFERLCKHVIIQII